MSPDRAHAGSGRLVLFFQSGRMTLTAYTLVRLHRAFARVLRFETVFDQCFKDPLHLLALMVPKGVQVNARLADSSPGMLGRMNEAGRAHALGEKIKVPKGKAGHHLSAGRRCRQRPVPPP